jgi:hypothetical protein
MRAGDASPKAQSKNFLDSDTGIYCGQPIDLSSEQWRAAVQETAEHYKAIISRKANSTTASGETEQPLAICARLERHQGSLQVAPGYKSNPDF